MTAIHSENSAALDDAAVRSLVARIAQLLDSGAVDDYADSFSTDARFETPQESRTDRESLRTATRALVDAGQLGPGTKHFIGASDVAVDGDRARSTSYFQFFVDTTATPRLLTLGRYDDELVRTPSGWQVDHRRITIG